MSGNFFRTLGIQPWIGRLMVDADDREGAPPVAVMSYRIWHDKYGADPSVLGAGYQINGHPFTIIGVAPPGFYGAKLAGWGMPDFWLPLTAELTIDGATARLKRPNGNFLDLIGRVRPGVNAKSLEARLKVEFQDWLASHVADMEPGEKQLWRQQTLHLIPGGAGVAAMRDEYEDGLKLLLIAAACVLLVACANLANLMLARGLKDRTQMSIRVALGASRARLVRKVLVESLLLALVGGLLGIGVAYAGTRLMLRLAFQTAATNNYVPIDAAPSWPILIFALAVSILTGVLFGIAPAWMNSHTDPVDALRGAGRAIGAGRSWAQKSLVVAQIAVSIVLLSAAALLARSLRNLEHQNFGFETQDRYIAWINPMLGNYKPEQLEPLFRQIDDSLLRIPGVRMVAPALYAPMTGDSWNDGIRIEGRPEPPAKEDTSAGWARVMPGFFETIGAKIVLGRPITERDTAAGRKVAVINQAFARRFFKDQNPIGQHFGPDKIKYSATFEIVGVTNDIRYMTWGYKDPVRPMYWLPEAQTVAFDDPAFSSGEIWSHYLYNIVLWAPGSQSGMEQQVRKALAGVDPNLVLYRGRPLCQGGERGFPTGKNDCDPDHAFRRAGTGAGGGRPVWRAGVYGGAAYRRNRCAHGPGRGPRPGRRHGARRRIPAGRRRIRARPAGRDRGRQTDEQPVVRRQAMGSGHARARCAAACPGSPAGLRNSRLARGQCRADGGASHRVTKKYARAEPTPPTARANSGRCRIACRRPLPPACPSPRFRRLRGPPPARGRSRNRQS